ncbi:glycoside hydrolase superfamily [Cercophora newfieldiana]|uniref:alpha-amylase n=1 Tax=Cercophora newfieldiana TaxID=92897 RepID=A0AA40CU26_9PEZI|nr:glycoside hydrolase superfamily [Cercophora newfieldiana]
MRASVLSAAAAALAFSGLASAANLTEWKSRSIYQVMIDRYALTDGSTDHECEAHLFCGGTWAGLMNKLDYIEDLGFTAIQISPIVKNIEEHTAVGDAYHGYWSLDNYALNDKFGTEDDFKSLVAELHKRDILLMVDVVVNNMVQAFDNVVPPKIDYSKFNPFNDKKYFHPYCNVTEWDNATNYQDCWLYPYGVALADLDTRQPAVINELGSWVEGLVSNYSIDGLRIDAAKHVNDEFLPKFVEAAGVFSIGEVLTGEIDDFCRYQTMDLLQGMPNYLEYYPLGVAFNGGSFLDLEDIRNKAKSGCTDIFALGAFLENHDMPRFASKNEDLALAKNAMTYILLTDGIPTVYQGQEQHFKGNSTPFNREPLWQSGYDKTAPIYVLTATLNKLRKHAMKLSAEYTEYPSETVTVDNNHYCLRKGPSGSQIVTCITNKSSSGDSYPLIVGGFEANDEVVEVLGCASTTADAAGTFTSYQFNGEPRVYARADMLQGTDLCPTTTIAGPKVGAASVSGAATGLIMAVTLGWAVLFLA